MVNLFCMNKSSLNKESRWFGRRPVTPEEKTSLVHGVFDSVADKYDIMNDMMSGGVHRLWKDKFVRQICPRSKQSFVDVAGGTGDIAFRIRRKTGPNSDIAIFDLNQNMLTAGRNRAIDRGWLNDFEWLCGNAEALPFPDNSRDVYTIAFGLRNVTHIDKALKEAHRVLKPGGRFFCLEFSHVNSNILSKAYKAYSKLVIPNLGQLIAKDRESYDYLIESIERFPSQNELADRLENAGFEKVRYTNLSSGIAAIHQGLRI